MARTLCPRCGRRVYPLAPKCPHCGKIRPRQFANELIVGAAAALIVILFFAILFGPRIALEIWFWFQRW